MIPVLKLGFRPFYLLATMFAVVAVAAWLMMFTGQLQLGGEMQGIIWHSHEMVFGFQAAVITGFLFTAVRNWTGQPTPTGMALGLIALLWIAARILLVTGPVMLGVAVDVLFLPVIAIAVGIPIVRSSNQRNYKVIGILVAVCALHFIFHLAYSGKISASLSRTSLLAAVDVVAILFALVGGRVIPAFTRNAVPGSNPVHRQWVEVGAFGLLVLIVIATLRSAVAVAATPVPALLFFMASALHWIRLALWQPHLTLGNPLLWMMPVAYSWLPLALLLRGLAHLGYVSPGVWIHALTMGALSSLMIAMMMRSSLGHTGRMLEASRADMAAFLLLQLAAILRAFGFVTVAGVAWCLAFGVFLLRYAPMLTKPRVDGRPG